MLLVVNGALYKVVLRIFSVCFVIKVVLNNNFACLFIEHVVFMIVIGEVGF